MYKKLIIGIAAVILTPYAAFGQTVGTYTEDNGATKNNIGVVIATSAASEGVNAPEVQGNAASGATDTGNPVKIGGRYSVPLPTLANGQRGDIQLDTYGNIQVLSKYALVTAADTIANTNITSAVHSASPGASGGTVPLVVAPYVFNGSSWDRRRGDVNGSVVTPGLTSTYWNFASAASGIVNTTTATTIKAAAGASVRNYVSSMQCTSDTLGAATELVLRDGAAGAVMFRSKIQTSGLPSWAIQFSPPLKGTANTLVEIATLTASVTGGVYCNVQGFTGS